MEASTLLGRLLRELHVASYAEFLREYRKVAVSVGGQGAGPGPSRAQLHRWLTGRISGLPQPHHRRVLEAMFPGRSVTQLLSPPGTAGPGRPAAPAAPKLEVPPPSASPGPAGERVVVYPDRAAFAAGCPLASVARGAGRLRAAGVSLDLLFRHLPVTELATAVSQGLLVECLLLDPDGVWIRRRSVELGHEPGYLPAVTRRSLDLLDAARAGLPASLRGHLEVGLYDEAPRYTVLLVDDALAIVQAYLPHAPAAGAPTIVVEREQSAALYAVYERVFDELADAAVPR